MTLHQGSYGFCKFLLRSILTCKLHQIVGITSGTSTCWIRKCMQMLDEPHSLNFARVLVYSNSVLAKVEHSATWWKEGAEWILQVWKGPLRCVQAVDLYTVRWEKQRVYDFLIEVGNHTYPHMLAKFAQRFHYFHFNGPFCLELDAFALLMGIFQAFESFIGCMILLSTICTGLEIDLEDWYCKSVISVIGIHGLGEYDLAGYTDSDVLHPSMSRFATIYIYMIWYVYIYIDINYIYIKLYYI